MEGCRQYIPCPNHTFLVTCLGRSIAISGVSHHFPNGTLRSSSSVKLICAPLFRWQMPIQQQVNRFEGSILQVGQGQKPVIARDNRMAARPLVRLFAGKPEISLLSAVELFG